MCGSLVGCIDLEHRFEITAVLIKKKVGLDTPVLKVKNIIQCKPLNSILLGVVSCH